MENIAVQFVLVFQDADTRRIKFNDVSSSVLMYVKGKIQALNQNMPEAFASTFVSNNGAKCIQIKDAKIIETTEEVIYNASR